MLPWLLAVPVAATVEASAVAAPLRLPHQAKQAIRLKQRPRRWQPRVPAFFKLALAPASRLDAVRWHAPGFDPAWQWRSGSQAVFTSNVGQFERGAAALGSRHRLSGFFYQAQPLLHGHLVGHVDHQALRFSEPRYNYASLMGSVSLTHMLSPRVHLFEGGAMLDRQAQATTDLAVLDTSLFAGVGTYGNLGATGAWAATVSAERIAAQALRDSYYGQSLRLRALGPLGTQATVQGQLTVQRIDPVVRTTPFLRAYLEGTVDRVVWAGLHLGLQSQLGFQARDTRDVYFTAGPYLQVAF
jgi:hypothetical protein